MPKKKGLPASRVRAESLFVPQRRGVQPFGGKVLLPVDLERHGVRRLDLSLFLERLRGEPGEMFFHFRRDRQASDFGSVAQRLFEREAEIGAGMPILHFPQHAR